MAPLRTAMLEQLVCQPVLIHGCGDSTHFLSLTQCSMLGEDGRIAGNPDCDIQLVNASIDLAGLPLLNPTTITIVRVSRLPHMVIDTRRVVVGTD